MFTFRSMATLKCYQKILRQNVLILRPSCMSTHCIMKRNISNTIIKPLPQLGNLSFKFFARSKLFIKITLVSSSGINEVPPV